MSSVKRSPILSPASKREQKLLNESIGRGAALAYMKEKATNGPYGALPKIVQRYWKLGHSWISRSIIQKHEAKIQKEATTAAASRTAGRQGSTAPNTTSGGAPLKVVHTDSQETVVSDMTGSPPELSITMTTTRSTGGRPKGSTMLAKAEASKRYKEALSKAAHLYKIARQEARKENQGGSVVAGTLKQIIDEVELEYNLLAGTIKKDTIRTRVDRDNITGFNPATAPPLEEIEDIIAEYCVRLAQIGCPLIKRNVIDLAMSLIIGSKYEKKLLEWKHSHSHHDPSKDLLGPSWYKGFMSRHADRLLRISATVKDVKRNTWVTYENFSNMYDNIYASLIDAGVARRLPEKVRRNRSGTIVADDDEDAFGFPSDIEIIHPEWILFVDEVGVNTNQKEDGSIGGEKHIVPVDDPDARMTGATTDIHFTVLVFQAATGEPVLVAVILKSNKTSNDVDVNWKLGIDWLALRDLGLLDVEAEASLDKTMDVLSCYGKDIMPGGPSCTFRGKTIPCFVATSPKASITSILLKQMLQHIDSYGIYDRAGEKRLPALILDGHHSRLEVPFLDYIHGDGHKWKTCFGVPYGTHVWQLADSSQVNGKFKMGVTKIKRQIYEAKPDNKKHFGPTDVIPILNYAYEQGFGHTNISSIKHAIADRGWYPANYALLNHPAVVKTKESTMSSYSSSSSTPTTSLMEATTKRRIVFPEEESINMSTGTAGEYMEKLLRDTLKKDGMRQKLKRQKEEEDARGKLFDKLKNATKISSGTLGMANEFTLTEDVHTLVANKAAETNRKVEEQEAKRKQRHQAKLQKINKAYATRMGVSDISQLNVGVLSTLSAQLGGPSPLGKKKNELVEQVRKRERRLQMTTTTCTAAAATSNLSAMMEQDEDKDDTTLKAFLAKLTPQGLQRGDSTNSTTQDDHDTGSV